MLSMTQSISSFAHDTLLTHSPPPGSHLPYRVALPSAQAHRISALLGDPPGTSCARFEQRRQILAHAVACLALLWAEPVASSAAAIHAYEPTLPAAGGGSNRRGCLHARASSHRSRSTQSLSRHPEQFLRHAPIRLQEAVWLIRRKSAAGKSAPSFRDTCGQEFRHGRGTVNSTGTTGWRGICSP